MTVKVIYNIKCTKTGRKKEMYNRIWLFRLHYILMNGALVGLNLAQAVTQNFPCSLKL